MNQKTLPKVRFSIIDYLNALPLNMAFKDGLFENEACLQFDYPSQCADNLASRKADVGLISSIEYQRIPQLVVAPHVCIAARNEVRSVLIVAKKDLAEVQTVALDRFSRSSVALLQIVLRRRYGAKPQFVTMAPEPESMLREADAALIIGDAALALNPVAFQTTDLAGEWFRETGLPFVFAFWAMHPGALASSASAMVQRAKIYGLDQLWSRVGEIQARWNFPETEIRRYFTENLHYDLGPLEKESLSRFYHYAHEARLIGKPEALRFAPAEV